MLALGMGMARRRRLYAPARVHHVISRVRDGEFRIDDAERREYLRRVPRAMGFTDWLALAYAVMSNHVHWAKFAALMELSRFFASIHSGFAHSVNAAQKRNGPFFMGRPGDWIVQPSLVANTIAYIHNNPVRAGVVRSPEESEWTSHRAYIGLEPAPPWLDIEAGLLLSGFDATPAGRAAFHEYVCNEIDVPRDERFAWSEPRVAQASARAALNAPVELGSATLGEEGAQYPVLAPVGALVRPRWPGELDDVLELIARDTGIPICQIRSGSRVRTVAHARRTAILLAQTQLGIPLTEMAAAVGVSPSSACNLLRRFKGDMRALEQSAAELGARLWARSP